MRQLVVTMATPNFRERANGLAGDCVAHGMDCEIYELPSLLRSEALMQKPHVILSALRKHQRPIWWVDADDSVLGKFDKPFSEISIGLIDNPEQKVIKTVLTISSSCIYFKGDQCSMKFVQRWIDLLSFTINDHRALFMAAISYGMGKEALLVTGCNQMC